MTIWIVMEQGIQNGKPFSRFKAFSSFDKVKEHLIGRCNSLTKQNYQVKEISKSRYRLFKQREAFDIFAYSAEIPEISEDIVSNFYRYKGNYFHMVMHNDVSNKCTVYLYNKSRPSEMLKLYETNNLIDDEDAIKEAVDETEEAIKKGLV